MAQFQIRKVTALPEVLVGNMMYIVQATDAALAEIVFTNAAGDASRKVIDKATVEALIADALNNALPVVGEAGEQKVIVTIDAQGRVTGSRDLTYQDVALAGKLSNHISGNADTATMADEAIRVQASLTINGSEFDGSTPVSLTLVPAAEKGAAGGVATLDETGKVPAGQLPSYVDDVLEAETFEDLPETGERDKLYVVLTASEGARAGDVFRWTGSIYVKVSDAVSQSDVADTLSTARAFSISGDLTAEPVQFNGSAAVELVAVLPAVGTAGEQKVVPTTDDKGRVTGSRDLVAADVALAGELENDIAGNAATATTAGGIDIGTPQW